MIETVDSFGELQLYTGTDCTLLETQSSSGANACLSIKWTMQKCVQVSTESSLALKYVFHYTSLASDSFKTINNSIDSILSR